MIRVVADASVVVKWLFADHKGEADSELALALLREVREGNVSLLQPPHWLAEVAAVLDRLSPKTVDDDVTNLYALELPVLQTPGMYSTACRLARLIDQHLFDTLYHAVALEAADTVLVTADERYFKKAASYGSIALLKNFRLPDNTLDGETED
jgi:predicted nucleic acid-binding protein